jgi:hypothetical protein
MDALSELKRIAACLFAQSTSFYPLFAYSISSCKGDLNQRIPVQPDNGKSWVFETNCIFWGKEGGYIGKRNNTYFETSGGC